MRIDAMDLRAEIVAHPWRSVAAAFALGAALAAGEASRSRLVRSASTALGGWLVAGFQSVAKNRIAAAVTTASGSHSVS